MALTGAVLAACGAAPAAPRHLPDGVTRGRIGEDIIGSTRRELVARLGEPMTVPGARRRRCVHYEQLSGKFSFAWRFCFRHGRVHSASGSPGVPLHGRRPR